VFHTVCKFEDLPDRHGYLVEVDGEGIALFRIGSELHALANACPHREGPLAFGDVRGGMVYCPLHAWGFDVRTGECDDPAAAGARTFRVRVEGDDVQIEL
jgi:nitrite reductase (NADH) small subunit